VVYRPAGGIPSPEVGIRTRNLKSEEDRKKELRTRKKILETARPGSHVMEVGRKKLYNRKREHGNKVGK
jgi:hypothetical protein